MLKQFIKSILLNIKWRKHNKNNLTRCYNRVDYSFIEVGRGTYGILNIQQGKTGSYLKIGNFCSVGDGTVFLLQVEHEIYNISTYPFKTKIENSGPEAGSKGDIIVDDDVWIGERAIILSGVHIGQGAVIAAGAVVTKDVPLYAIVGGFPAKVIKYRFNNDMIKELLKIDFSKLDSKMVLAHIDDLYKPLENIDQLSWLP